MRGKTDYDYGTQHLSQFPENYFAIIVNGDLGWVNKSNWNEMYVDYSHFVKNFKPKFNEQNEAILIATLSPLKWPIEVVKLIVSYVIAPSTSQVKISKNKRKKKKKRDSDEDWNPQ